MVGSLFYPNTGRRLRPQFTGVHGLISQGEFAEAERELRTVLGLTDAMPKLDELKTWGGTQAGTPIGALRSLFPRIVAGKEPAAADAAREPR